MIITPPFTDGQKKLIEATEKIIAEKGKVCDIDDDLDNYEQTNEEFLRNCSTEELVSEILSLVDGGILDSWHEEHKEIDEWDDKGVVELWLKEKHDGSN